MNATMHDKLHLKQTEAFIAQNPVSIEITRTKKIPDGKGGFKKDSPQHLDAQVVRKIGSTRISDSRELTTPEGRIVVPTAALVAMPDADIQAGDTFLIADVPYEVIKTNLDPPWRLQAPIVEQA